MFVHLHDDTIAGQREKYICKSQRQDSDTSTLKEMYFKPARLQHCWLIEAGLKKTD